MKMDELRIIGYEWCDGRRLCDGRPIPGIGEWIEYEGGAEIGERGMHCSKHPLDALHWHPGSISSILRVEVTGALDTAGDPPTRYAGTEGRVLGSVDARPVLGAWKRWCARRVLHLWPAPPIVQAFLTTGDESLRCGAAAKATAAWDTVEGFAARQAVKAAECAAAEAATARAAAGAFAAKAATYAAAQEAAAAGEYAAEGDAIAADAHCAEQAAQRAELRRLVEEAFAIQAREGGPHS